MQESITKADSMKVNKKIIYDRSCPMCAWYTNQFVRHGLLSRDGRIAFADLDPKCLPYTIDTERSRHEIPLIDAEGGATLYGLDSLRYLLAQRFPIVDRMLRIPVFYYCSLRLYRFVSYNRRIIVPSAAIHERGIDCSPRYNPRYRWAYILFCGVLSMGLLSSFPMLLIANVLLVGAVMFYNFKHARLPGRFADHLAELMTMMLLFATVVFPAVFLPMLLPIFLMLGTCLAGSQLHSRWRKYSLRRLYA